jgi:hypothetical protein
LQGSAGAILQTKKGTHSILSVFFVLFPKNKNHGEYLQFTFGICENTGCCFLKKRNLTLSLFVERQGTKTFFDLLNFTEKNFAISAKLHNFASSKTKKLCQQYFIIWV